MEQNQFSPLVSICIPVYNNMSYLEETLKSISNQTYKNIEIIIGDNASTEDIKPILSKFNLHNLVYYRNDKNLGYAGNCNKLISKAKGKYVAIYHSDDVYLPNIVEREVEFLEKNQNVGAVFTLNNLINSKSHSIDRFKDKLKRLYFTFYMNKFKFKDDMIITINKYINCTCKMGNKLVCPSSMVRRNLYNELDGYNETLRYIEDQDMWLRLLKVSKIGVINNKLIRYRIHDNQGSTYYESGDRNDVTVDLIHLRNFIKENNLITKSNDRNLSKRFAKDYIKIVRYNIAKGEIEKAKTYATKSKNEFRFLFPSYKYLLQNINKKYIYILLKKCGLAEKNYI